MTAGARGGRRGGRVPAAGPLAGIGIALATLAQPAAAQLPRPAADWRTLETAHVQVHFPVELTAWSTATAARLESIHEAVTAMVGYAPERKVTVIVHDPDGRSNGYAFPGGTLVLYPTPPEPGTMLGEARGWGEILAVHELVHVAHLARPSRNPRDRLLAGLVPFPVQVLQARIPRWAIEGYATLLEGRLTGSGRPYGAWRPAVLRQWALEGALPPYDEIGARQGGFLQPAMAYLVGSAYLEWLVERSGEASLPDVWLRLTARERRSFDEAFAGVFGGPPAELYGRFVVATTEKALAVEDSLAAAGIVDGTLVQRLEGGAGDPAVSPDGRHLAIVRRPDPEEPPDVVVWTTAEDTISTEERERRARARAADPEDVPAVEWRPRPKTAVARLGPVGGIGHDAPRWMPDGERILVVRPVGTGDGRLRGDLFAWRWREGGLERITEGAGLRSADPEPGGRTAVAERCGAGTCGIVRVDLATGALETVAPGTLARSLHRPRVAPDGRIAVTARDGGRWRIAFLDPTGALTWADPDDGASRAEHAFLPGGELVVTSDRGGVPDLERIDPGARSARPLTRVTGAALAPAPSPDGSVFFLSLTSHGHDLMRLAAAAPLDLVVALDPGLAPVARPEPFPVDSFAVGALPGPRPYGIGPRDRSIWPTAFAGPEGWALGAAVHGTDPVGRLAWLGAALLGAESAWRGASLGLAWRGTRPSLHVAAAWARQRPSEQARVDPVGLDHELGGAAAWAELRRDFVSHAQVVRAGAAVGRLDRPGADDGGRTLGFLEAAAADLRTWGDWRVESDARAHGALGSTAGESWARAILGWRVAVGRGGPRLALEGLRGWAEVGDAGFEAFAVGGTAAPLHAPAVLAQRIPEPAAPVGYATGERIDAATVALESGAARLWYRWIDGDGGGWRRTLGFEAGIDRGPIPFLGVPAHRIALGVGRALDPPFEDRTRVYGRAAFRP